MMTIMIIRRNPPPTTAMTIIHVVERVEPPTAGVDVEKVDEVGVVTQENNVSQAM